MHQKSEEAAYSLGGILENKLRLSKKYDLTAFTSKAKQSVCC